MLKKVVFAGLAFGLAFGSLTSTSFAQAQQRGGTDQEQKACERDVARHCKAVINADDFTILRCLQANRTKLRPVCLKVLTDHGQ
jgi:hypothetical protein